MTVGELAALLARLPQDEELIVEITPALFDDGVLPPGRCSLDLDRVTVTAVPMRLRDGQPGALVRTVLGLKP